MGDSGDFYPPIDTGDMPEDAWTDTKVGHAATAGGTILTNAANGNIGKVTTPVNGIIEIRKSGFYSIIDGSLDPNNPETEAYGSFVYVTEDELGNATYLLTRIDTATQKIWVGNKNTLDVYVWKEIGVGGDLNTLISQLSMSAGKTVYPSGGYVNMTSFTVPADSSNDRMVTITGLRYGLTYDSDFWEDSWFEFRVYANGAYAGYPHSPIGFLLGKSYSRKFAPLTFSVFIPASTTSTLVEVKGATQAGYGGGAGDINELTWQGSTYQVVVVTGNSTAITQP